MDKKEFSERVKPLQKEVRYLGNLLGRVLQEQEGKAFLELVETVRKDTIELRRRYRPTLESQILKRLKSLNHEKLLKLIRAFTVYFQLVNLAEEKHRIRRKRSYESEGKIQLGSIEDVVQRLKRAKISFGNIEKALNEMQIELVLTAHPTEAQRRSVLEKIFLIEKLLFEREYRVLTPREKQANEASIYEAIILLWQTDELRRRKQTVIDEVDNGLFYLDEVMYEALPDSIDHFFKILSKNYKKKIKYRPVLKFGSWIGGDRDGNPFVTHEITWEAMRRQKELILKKYIRTLDDLIELFSQSIHLVGATNRLTQSIEHDVRLLPLFADSIKDQSQGEPYRKKLKFMQRKLINTLRLNTLKMQRRTSPDKTIEGSYLTSDGFRNDIQVLMESLKKNKGDVLLESLEHLLLCLDLFGFYFAKLDIRESARVVQEVVHEVIEKARFSDASY